MAIQNAEELFISMLSNVRSREELKLQWFHEISKDTKDPELKQLVDTRAYVQQQIVGNLDMCFKQLGKQPMKTETKFRETWLEDFRKERDMIQQPALRAVYTYERLAEVVDLHRAAYVALIAMADATGHYSVGFLLESALADKAAFVERNRRILREFVETAIGTRMEAAA